MSEELKQSQIDELVFASAQHVFEDCDVNGIETPMRRVTIMEILRIAKKHPPFAEALNSGATNLLAIAAMAGPEPIAAFVAVSRGKRGKEALAYEQALCNAPDEVTLPLAAHAFRLTLGEEGLESFFGRLEAVGVQTGLLKLPPAPPKDVEQDVPTDQAA